MVETVTIGCWLLFGYIGTYGMWRSRRSSNPAPLRLQVLGWILLPLAGPLTLAAFISERYKW